MDPATLESNPPLLAIASRIWDDPSIRSDFIRGWMAARADAQRAGCKWHWVRGPIGAAWVSLARVQGEWVSPFVVRLLGQDVCMKDVLSLQLKAILQAHARRHLDGQLIERLLSARPEWDAEAIRPQYQHGIDWVLVRHVLQGKLGNLTPG